MATSYSNKSKMYLTTAGVLAFGVAAYGLGRVYPPLGPTAGTIAPAQRYVSGQVGEGDVTLGDTSVPELMQTDAFQVMVKDPNFRALANDPGFAALAENPPAMSALPRTRAPLAALAKSPSAFASMLRQTSQLSAASQATAASASALMRWRSTMPLSRSSRRDSKMFSALAGNASAFSALANHP